MKKLFALLLVGLMLLSLCACGGKNETATTEAPTEPQDELVGTRWIGLNYRMPISFSEDGKLTIWELDGTWERNENVIEIKYTGTDGNVTERTFDIAEEDGMTVLKSRREGMNNGSSTNYSVDTYYTEEQFDAKRASIVNNLGDTVSTDMADFTLNSAEFSYYASALSSSYATPIDEDDGGIFVASTGRVFVCMTFTIKNKDRGGSLDIGGMFSDWTLNFNVLYNGKSYTVKQFDLNNKDGSYGLGLAYAAFSYDGGNTFSKGNGSSNILLGAGKTVTIRTMGIISVDPQDLSDAFDININVLNSNDKDENFLYEVK